MRSARYPVSTARFRTNLLVYPVIVGRCKRLAEAMEIRSLELIKSTAFDNGVIHELYRPAF
jgi:hypothetical protein